MKKIVFLALLLYSFHGYGQNFEIGVNGGFNFHALPINNMYTSQDKPKIGYALNAKAVLNIVNTQIGIGVEMVNLYQYNYIQPAYTTKVYNYLAKPLIAPHFLLNRIFSFPTAYAYAGIMAGAAIAKVGVNTDVYNGTGGTISGYTTSYNSATGFIGGIQAGFVIKVSKVIGINGEAALRYADYNYKDVTTTLLDNPYHYKIVYFPMTVGLRFHI